MDQDILLQQWEKEMFWYEMFSLSCEQLCSGIIMTEKQYFEEVGLNSDQVTELRQAFDSFDSDKTGAISSETTGKTSKILVK